MELRKDKQITLNIDGFIISQNIHNTNTAQSLFGIKNKNNLSIGHDNRTWVLEQDIICDTCNRCVSCQTCNSCDGCVSSVGCNDRCQGCTGSCTGCASGCYESCFGDCYTCQDCQAGCTSCDSCTAGCDGGCQTECYACVNCDGCVGCNGECVSCQGTCQNCTTCAGFTGCTPCVKCNSDETCTSCVGCDSACQTNCNVCVDCTGGCQTSCQVCDGCTSSCQAGCQSGCQTGCTGSCQNCNGGCNGSCNSGCTSCTSCIGCDGCVGCTGCTGCNSCNGCASSVCGGCTEGCQGGCQSGCQSGCTTGSYCYTNQCGSNTGPGEGDEGGDDQEGDVIEPGCWNTDSGGYGKNPPTNSGCKTGGYDGENNGKAPNSWLKSGKTQAEWDALSREGVEDYAKEHGIEIKPTDPKGGDDGTPFVGPELKAIDKALGLNGEGQPPTNYHVDYKYNPDTGLNEGTVIGENGKILGTITQTPGSEDFTIKNENNPEGVKSSTSKVKVNQDTGETGDPHNKTENNDGSSTESTEEGTKYTGSDGKTVDVAPTGGGC